MSCCPTPLTDGLRRVVGLPLLSNVISADALPADSAWGAETRLDAARADLADARAALAAAHRAQPVDRHFRGLPESVEVIAAYDAVRAAEAAVGRLERERRRP